MYSMEVPVALSSDQQVQKNNNGRSIKVATRTHNGTNDKPIMTETIGGSADLSGSNNTKSTDMTVFDEMATKGMSLGRP